ncbi:putative aldehyde dehydrogenase-like protein [Fusarium oxysporum f. sp. albedinis]|nr:putative aldehyde dehydrogenase-like protein [Fusarium oxysporum f. sp. albedinis]
MIRAASNKRLSVVSRRRAVIRVEFLGGTVAITEKGITQAAREYGFMPISGARRHPLKKPVHLNLHLKFFSMAPSIHPSIGFDMDIHRQSMASARSHRDLFLNISHEG